ncbi:MAG: DNA adenine methylase [Planctomycetes bacterium]|nr:DNA adenine methylase [Planctomycetota bacterium]
MKNFIPYIGGKYNLVGHISKRLHATGRTCLVDVFGGSGAVTLHSGFRKRIYNDINGDIVNLFRVMADDKARQALLRKLRWTPPSRQIFEDDREVLRRGGFSFRRVECPIERARMTLYKHIFSFGGKVRTGGFAVSTKDRSRIKEVNKYQNVLRSLSLFGKFFLNTVIENLDFTDLIELYGHKDKVVFFIDPPYPGFSAYYSNNFSSHQHELLAAMLIRIPAPAICTFYDHPLIRRLYPPGAWEYEVVSGRKNGRQGGNRETDELILTKKELSRDQIDRYFQKTVRQMDLFRIHPA